MKSLVRGKVAGLLLILTPIGSLASEAFPPEAGGRLGFLGRVLVLSAWLPAAQGLEHFLKRRSELVSLAVVGLATLGIVARLLALALATNPALDAEWKLAADWTARAGALFPLGLLVCGLGFRRWRCVPPLFGVLLALGGLIGTWHAIAPQRGLPLLSNLCIAGACGWIGWKLVQHPKAWENAEL